MVQEWPQLPGDASKPEMAQLLYKRPIAGNATMCNSRLPFKPMAEMKKGIAISKLTETAIKNLQSMHAA